MSGVKLFSLQMEGSKRKYGVTYRNEKENLTDPKDMHFEKFQPDAEQSIKGNIQSDMWIYSNTNSFNNNYC